MTTPFHNNGDKSAFLETNALVRLFEFWDVCRDAEIRLDSVNRWGELHAQLRENADYLRSSDYGNVKVGITLFKNISAAVDAEDYLLLTSRFCQAELHHTLVEYWASIHLTQDKIPFGLRTQRPHFLYDRVIDTVENQEVSQKLDAFFESLRLDYVLNVMAVEDLATTGSHTEYLDILETAKAIWTRILLATMDAIMLGTAIRAEASVFMSSDQAMRTVLKRIRTDAELRQSLNEAIGRDATAEMPLALSLRDMLLNR